MNNHASSDRDSRYKRIRNPVESWLGGVGLVKAKVGSLGFKAEVRSDGADQDKHDLVSG
jgi:hypothetical protein